MSSKQPDELVPPDGLAQSRHKNPALHPVRRTLAHGTTCLECQTDGHYFGWATQIWMLSQSWNGRPSSRIH